MPEKITLQSFFADVVIPQAAQAKQWKTDQFKAACTDACEFLTSGQMDATVFTDIMVKLSNTSALRQDMEKAGIIPTKSGDNWLSKLTKD